MKALTTPFYQVLVRHADIRDDLAVGETVPAWSYASPDDPRLAELRERYGLARVIEGRAELDAIRALLDWAYRIVEHDGGAHNPAPRDALNILRTCETTGARVNCRMKAIVLCEALLAVGFRARYVTCLPAVSDGDCHVITLAYAASVGKWVSVDPTFNTYFSAEDGAMLNVVEARRAYRSGQVPRHRRIDLEARGPLCCGGIECASYDEFYDLYMCKNSFRFACTLASEPGIDSHEAPATVVLAPPDDPWVAEGGPAEWRRPVVVTHSKAAFLAPPGQ